MGYRFNSTTDKVDVTCDTCGILLHELYELTEDTGNEPVYCEKCDRAYCEDQANGITCPCAKVGINRVCPIWRIVGLTDNWLIVEHRNNPDYRELVVFKPNGIATFVRPYQQMNMYVFIGTYRLTLPAVNRELAIRLFEDGDFDSKEIVLGEDYEVVT